MMDLFSFIALGNIMMFKGKKIFRTHGNKFKRVI